MNWLSETLVYGIDWRVWGWLSAIPVLAVFALAVRLFGVPRALAVAAAIGAFLAGLVALRRSRQQGWEDREAKLDRDTAAATARYREITDDTARLPDADLDRANAPWLRQPKGADPP